MDAKVKFGDSVLNSGRIIQIFAGRTRSTHFCAVFSAFCSRPEVDSDVISGVAVDCWYGCLEIFEGLISCRTNMIEAHHIKQKRFRLKRESATDDLCDDLMLHVFSFVPLSLSVDQPSHLQSLILKHIRR